MGHFCVKASLLNHFGDEDAFEMAAINSCLPGEGAQLLARDLWPREQEHRPFTPSAATWWGWGWARGQAAGAPPSVPGMQHFPCS